MATTATELAELKESWDYFLSIPPGEVKTIEWWETAKEMREHIAQLEAENAALQEELVGYKAANYYDNAQGLSGAREAAYMAYHLNEITAAQFVEAWEAAP